MFIKTFENTTKLGTRCSFEGLINGPYKATQVKG